MSTFFYILLISQHLLTQKHQVIASTNVILQIFLNLSLKSTSSLGKRFRADYTWQNMLSKLSFFFLPLLCCPLLAFNNIFKREMEFCSTI